MCNKPHSETLDIRLVPSHLELKGFNYSQKVVHTRAETTQHQLLAQASALNYKMANMLK